MNYPTYERFELTQKHPDYPQALNDLVRINPFEAVMRLYAIGNLELLARPALALVGARKASPYGISAAQMAVEAALDHDLVLVSGGAIGCDGVVLERGVRYGKPVITVLGCGADIVYPRRHQALFEQSLECGGLILSENPWGAKPLAWTFPRRNRIIAALAEALVVAEAGHTSGTYITAEYALELEREVLAVPGSIFNPRVAGCNRLIADGVAAGVWSADDLQTALYRIYGDFQSQPCSQTKAQLRGQAQQGSDDEQRVAGSHDKVLKIVDPYEPVICALLAGPVKVNALSDQLACDPLDVLRMLSAYEIEGLAQRQRDGSFCATERLLHHARQDSLR